MNNFNNYNETTRRIINNERQRFEQIADIWFDGRQREANDYMYAIFRNYGFISDNIVTDELLDYVGGLVGRRLKEESEKEWRKIEAFPEYECTQAGEVRRIDNKHKMKFSENDRYKLTKDGKTVTVRLIDVVAPTWLAKEKIETNTNDEEYVFSSSLEIDDVY